MAENSAAGEKPRSIKLGDTSPPEQCYHVPVPDNGMEFYVKFQADVVTEFRVMSFKER